jgi:hypothetical protein
MSITLREFVSSRAHVVLISRFEDGPENQAIVTPVGMNDTEIEDIGLMDLEGQEHGNNWQWDGVGSPCAIDTASNDRPFASIVARVSRSLWCDSVTNYYHCLFDDPSAELLERGYDTHCVRAKAQ